MLAAEPPISTAALSRPKRSRGDFDACWDVVGVDASLLDPVLLDFDDGRRAQKERFGGELFLANAQADAESGALFLDFFQRDRDGEPKGIIQIDLEDLT
jgi:hypothetical protein